SIYRGRARLRPTQNPATASVWSIWMTTARAWWACCLVHNRSGALAYRLPPRRCRFGAAARTSLASWRSKRTALAMTRDVYVAAVGMDRFGGKDRSLRERIIAAACNALADADVDFNHVQSLYLGSAISAPMFGIGVVKDLGLTGIPVVRVENASATG